MDISKLGEFGLINHLTKGYEKKNESTVYGVGDDCAVMHYPDKEVLMTTDMLMEGVHFDLTYIDMVHLGYKSAMVNISDIFAMNGTPRQMVVSIALSKRFKVEDIDEFYKGLRMACDKWGVDIVGGDTTSSLTGLAISITCIGEAAKEEIVYRNGAKETDLICVSGDLGGAYMGLQLLEREKAVYYGQIEDIRKKMAKPYQPDGSCYRTDDAGIEQSTAQHPCQHHHDELCTAILDFHLRHHGHLHALSWRRTAGFKPSLPLPCPHHDGVRHLHRSHLG